jgi:hypothetical protein
MQGLLVALGIPPGIAEYILGLPYPYVVLLVGVFVLMRWVLLPGFIKFLQSNFGEYVEAHKQTVVALKDISQTVIETQRMARETNSLVSIIAADSVGNTDENLAVSQFMQVMDAMHIRAKVFFQHRLAVNHFKGSEKVISGRYNSESQKLSGKCTTQLNKFHYNAIHLGAYFCDGGADSYFRHIFAELYDLQALKAEGELTSLTPDDISEGFERNLSRLTTQFREWLKNPDCTYNSTKTTISYQIIQEIESSLEEL